MPENSYLTAEDLDFEHSQPDLVRFMAQKASIQANREATVHFFQCGGYDESMPETLDILEMYSIHKFSAMTCRKNGYITTAKHIENIADSFYNQLPKYAKW